MQLHNGNSEVGIINFQLSFYIHLMHVGSFNSAQWSYKNTFVVLFDIPVYSVFKEVGFMKGKTSFRYCPFILEPSQLI